MSESASVLPQLLTSSDVLAELDRKGLPSSKDALSRCLNALFWPGELTYHPGRDGRHHRPGHPGNAFTAEQLKLIVAAIELLRLHTFSLGYLKTLRRYARQRGCTDLDLFGSMVRLGRLHYQINGDNNGVEAELLQRSA